MEINEQQYGKTNEKLKEKKGKNIYVWIDRYVRYV